MRSLLWLTLRAQHNCAPTLSRTPSISHRRHRPRAAAPRAAWRSAARCRASTAPRPRAASVLLLKYPAQLVFHSWRSPQRNISGVGHTESEIQRLWPCLLRCAAFHSIQSTQASSRWSRLSIAPSRSSLALTCGTEVRLAWAVALLDTCRSWRQIELGRRVGGRSTCCDRPPVHCSLTRIRSSTTHPCARGREPVLRAGGRACAHVDPTADAAQTPAHPMTAW